MNKRSVKWRLASDFDYEFVREEESGSCIDLPDNDIESKIESEADTLFKHESQMPSCSSWKSFQDTGDNDMQKDLKDNGGRLRVKKWTKGQKPHRACRSNDCKYTPKTQSGKDLHISARNYKKIMARSEERNNAMHKSSSSPVLPFQSITGNSLLTSNNLNSSGLDTDLATFLLSLQDREITPNDYEILLQLDNFAVADKKKRAGRIIKRLQSEILEDASAYNNEQCVICMDSYAEGEKIKSLLCGHRFHSECLDSWMSNSGCTTCPLDNINIHEMKPQINGRVTEPSGQSLIVLNLNENESEASVLGLSSESGITTGNRILFPRYFSSLVVHDKVKYLNLYLAFNFVRIYSHMKNVFLLTKFISTDISDTDHIAIYSR